MAQKKKSTGSELTFTHLIVTALAMLVIGYLVGRISVGVPTATPVPPSQPNAAQADLGFDLAALERATRDAPDSADAWTILGDAYFDSGRYAEAVDAYTRSLAIDDQNPNVWTDRGIMFRRLGNFNAALSDFETAEQLDANHVMSRFNRGIVLNFDLGEVDAARASFQDALRIEPNFVTPGGVFLRDFIETLE